MADVNDIVTYMPPFRGFAMIRRVEVGKNLRRSLFRLLNPLCYHTHYDLPELYAEYAGEEDPPADRISGNRNPETRE